MQLLVSARTSPANERCGRTRCPIAPNSRTDHPERPRETFAAKERKEHKGITFYLCALYVILRP